MAQVREVLGECMLQQGVPKHVRSDNGAEMTGRRVKQWLRTVGIRPMFIEPGSPWENGYCESFNGKLRDECLDGEIFYSLKEAQVVVGKWRKHYNTVPPHLPPAGAVELDNCSLEAQKVARHYESGAAGGTGGD